MISGWTNTNKEKFKSIYKEIIGATPFIEKIDDIVSETIKENDSSEMHLDTGGPYTHYENRTKEQVYNLARELDISGRSTMNKNELIEAVREVR